MLEKCFYVFHSWFQYEQQTSISHSAHAVKIFWTSTPSLSLTPPPPLFFAKVMDFYCPHCETAMCQECTNGEHGEHPTVPLKDVVEQHKASLQEQLGAVKQRYGGSSGPDSAASPAT